MESPIKTGVSFYTTTYKRNEQIKQTLLQNLQDNVQYKNVEFILVDFNPDKILEFWIKNTCQKYLKSGLLKYYKIDHEKVEWFWHASIAKNTGAKLTNYSIIFNLDNDNFVGQNLVKLLLHIFNTTKNICIQDHDIADNSVLHDGTYGRICCTREDFFKLRGYDESMYGMGAQDLDLIYRLTRGLKNKIIRKYLDPTLKQKSLPNPKTDSVRYCKNNQMSWNEMNQYNHNKMVSRDLAEVVNSDKDYFGINLDHIYEPL